MFELDCAWDIAFEAVSSHSGTNTQTILSPRKNYANKSR